MRHSLLTVLLMLLACIQCLHAAEVSVGTDRTDDTDDDTVYFQGLVDQVQASGGGTVHIPTGTLTLSDTINITSKPVAIRGDNYNLTEIRFTAAGGISSTQGLTVSGVTMVTTVPNAGTAIYTSGGPSISNVVIKGATANDYWNKSVVIDGASGSISNCIMRGKNDGDNGTLYHIEHYGQTGGGGGISASNTMLTGAKIGVYVHNTHAEGHGFSKMIINDVEVCGVRTTSEPTFQWSLGWLRASDYGVQVDGSRDTSLGSNVFEITNGSAVTYSKRTMQNSEVLSNLIYAPVAVHAMTHRFNGDGSSMVDNIRVSGNYIKDAAIAYNLEGSETKYIYCGGNILDNVIKEFNYASNAAYILRTELEVRQ